MKIRIFLFHRVSPVKDPLWNPMSPELFERIIVYLNKKYELVPLEKTLLGEYVPSTSKPLCAITFDDGYKDFVQYAFPILLKYKTASSMYVITECVDKNLPPWTYIINHLFSNTSHLSLELNSKALPPTLQKTKWKNSSERLSYVRKLSPFLKKLNNHERLLIYNQIVNDFNDVDQPDNMMMTWDDIRYVAANNCEIGSHSFSHPLFARKTIDLKNELEISGNKILLESGKFPTAISYPFGSYNEHTKQLSKEIGYKVGLTVNHGTYDSDKHDLYEIPRIELYDESWSKSKLRINGVIESINKIIRSF